MNEFELIARWFARPTKRARLGVGDDCALLSLRPGFEFAISTDMLVADRHFLSDVDPEALGWKTLAVNLSDLAAMGAEPLAFTLALALPAIDEAWLDGFARGLFACATAHDCELVGGDTTRGPLTLSVTIVGEVPTGMALRRDGACVDDDVWVSGTLGDAALALDALVAGRVVDASARERLDRPTPRIALGRALRGIAAAAIDVSDGLAQDLGHILERSRVGATLVPSRLPMTAIVREHVDAGRFALAGGDDYELCFTAPRANRDAVETVARSTGTAVTRIGTIVAEPGLRLVDDAGGTLDDAPALTGFDHFA